jgi:hypothetical protein
VIADSGSKVEFSSKITFTSCLLDSRLWPLVPLVPPPPVKHPPKQSRPSSATPHRVTQHVQQHGEGHQSHSEERSAVFRPQLSLKVRGQFVCASYYSPPHRPRQSVRSVKSVVLTSTILIFVISATRAMNTVRTTIIVPAVVRFIVSWIFVVVLLRPPRVRVRACVWAIHVVRSTRVSVPSSESP